MGNVCNPQCAACQDVAEAKFDLADEMAVQQEPQIEQREGRPDLPRLGLRTQEDVKKEMMALAKIAALPHDISSSTEWSAATVNRNISSCRVIAPMESLPEEELTKAKHHQKDTSIPQVSINAPCMTVVFEAAGKEVTTHIYKRPLGAEFCKRSVGPVKVSKVFPQSYAWGLGLEVGWSLKSINGEDFSLSSFQEAQDALKEGLGKLPHHPSV
jgi:hypothetical protein